MLDVEKVTCLRDQFVARLSASYPELLSAHPLDCYIEQLDACPEIASYSVSNGNVREECESICRETSPRVLESYHQALLLSLILRAQGRLETSNLPRDIKLLYEDNFTRIVRNIERDSNPEGFYLCPSFAKELALCTLRLIPAGAQKIHLHGLSRRCFARMKPNELLRAVRLFLDLGGVKPLYEMHTDSRDSKAMSCFTPDGWAEFYRRVSALFELNPHVRGVFGVSWFFDPQLKHVSPKLAYLRDLVAENGGYVLRLGPCDANGIKDATERSPTRSQLHAAGKYLPTNYLVVWPRKALIAWAHCGH